MVLKQMIEMTQQNQRYHLFLFHVFFILFQKTCRLDFPQCNLAMETMQKVHLDRVD